MHPASDESIGLSSTMPVPSPPRQMSQASSNLPASSITLHEAATPSSHLKPAPSNTPGEMTTPPRLSNQATSSVTPSKSTTPPRLSNQTSSNPHASSITPRKSPSPSEHSDQRPSSREKSSPLNTTSRKKLSLTEPIQCDQTKVNKTKDDGDAEGDFNTGVLVEEDFYEVECIVDKRKCNGRTEYKVRWKGCSEGDDTWEPEENLCDSASKQRCGICFHYFLS